MNLYIASRLLPVQRRNDWAQSQLSYVSKRYYGALENTRSSLAIRMLRTMLRKREQS